MKDRMEKKGLLKSLALLRLAMEKRDRRQTILKMFQEEWNAVSSFLDDFSEESWNDLDDISKQKKQVEKEVLSLEKELISIISSLDIHALEELVSKEQDVDISSQDTVCLEMKKYEAHDALARQDPRKL
jgi:hypothetical protein